MNTRFHSARLIPKTVRTETPYVVKKKVGSKIKDWIFNTAWKHFEKWGNIKQHFDEVTIETFDFTESKQKTITNRILEELKKTQS